MGLNDKWVRERVKAIRTALADIEDELKYLDESTEEVPGPEPSHRTRKTFNADLAQLRRALPEVSDELWDEALRTLHGSRFSAASVASGLPASRRRKTVRKGTTSNPSKPSVRRTGGR